MTDDRIIQAAACVFCDRIAREDYDTIHSDVVSFEPLNPVTPGHRLFVPVEHVIDAAEKPWVSGRVMWAVAEFAAYSLPHRQFNLITSAGVCATQTVFHLHIHLVPRFVGDGLCLPWTDDAARIARGEQP